MQEQRVDPRLTTAEEHAEGVRQANYETMKRIITAVMALLMATSCNAQNKQEVKSSNKNNMSKSIVIFFSHVGDNYSVGNIEVGNTKIVADYITEIKGADQFEIVLSQYDTVFIGGPVWWGTYPQVMFTLFKDINLDGKTVIPFTTHEGSGLASCASDVKKAFPKAKVTGEFSIYGHEVRTGKAKVEKWLKRLK